MSGCAGGGQPLRPVLTGEGEPLPVSGRAGAALWAVVSVRLG